MTRLVIVCLCIFIAAGCVSSQTHRIAVDPLVTLDPTVRFQLGTSISSAKGSEYFFLEDEGKTIFHSGDHLAWRAIVGNAYDGDRIVVSLYRPDTGENVPIHSNVLDRPPNAPRGGSHVRGATVRLPKYTEPIKVKVRLTVGAHVEEIPIMLMPQPEG